MSVTPITTAFERFSKASAEPDEKELISAYEGMHAFLRTHEALAFVDNSPFNELELKVYHIKRGKTLNRPTEKEQREMLGLVNRLHRIWCDQSPETKDKYVPAKIYVKPAGPKPPEKPGSVGEELNPLLAPLKDCGALVDSLKNADIKRNEEAGLNEWIDHVAKFADEWAKGFGIEVAKPPSPPGPAAAPAPVPVKKLTTLQQIEPCFYAAMRSLSADAEMELKKRNEMLHEALRSGKRQLETLKQQFTQEMSLAKLAEHYIVALEARNQNDLKKYADLLVNKITKILNYHRDVETRKNLISIQTKLLTPALSEDDRKKLIEELKKAENLKALDDFLVKEEIKVLKQKKESVSKEFSSTKVGLQWHLAKLEHLIHVLILECEISYLPILEAKDDTEKSAALKSAVDKIDQYSQSLDTLEKTPKDLQKNLLTFQPFVENGSTNVKGELDKLKKNVEGLKTQDRKIAAFLHIVKVIEQFNTQLQQILSRIEAKKNKLQALKGTSEADKKSEADEKEAHADLIETKVVPLNALVKVLNEFVQSMHQLRFARQPDKTEERISDFDKIASALKNFQTAIKQSLTELQKICGDFSVAYALLKEFIRNKQKGLAEEVLNDMIARLESNSKEKIPTVKAPADADVERILALLQKIKVSIGKFDPEKGKFEQLSEPDEKALKELLEKIDATILNPPTPLPPPPPVKALGELTATVKRDFRKLTARVTKSTPEDGKAIVASAKAAFANFTADMQKMIAAAQGTGTK